MALPSVASHGHGEEESERGYGTIRRLRPTALSRYSEQMSRSEPDAFFPDLDDEERKAADQWLDDYLRLVLRIYREHQQGQLSTASSLTTPAVLERSVQLSPESNPTYTDEEVLRIHHRPVHCARPCQSALCDTRERGRASRRRPSPRRITGIRLTFASSNVVS